jgi:hypothetical protein
MTECATRTPSFHNNTWTGSDPYGSQQWAYCAQRFGGELFFKRFEDDLRFVIAVSLFFVAASLALTVALGEARSGKTQPDLQ